MIKHSLCLLCLLAGLQSSWGFALLGPETLTDGADAWQTATIGYDLLYLSVTYPGGPNYLGDIGGPRDIGQGYRRNTSVIYYTYDANFLGFFGSNGVVAVDSAVAIMNSLGSANQNDPESFSTDSTHDNYLAQSLYLTDLKSTALHCLVEQMGLAQPERYTWTLHDRVPGTACPVTTEYLLCQRNYETYNTPLNQIQYSSYVNNVLYTYSIWEHCTGPDPLATSVPFSVDPLSDQYTAVADSSYESSGELEGTLGTTQVQQFYGGLQVGGYYTGLTKDDVAGIDYLLNTNNIDWERATPGSLLFDVSTNYAYGEVQFPVNTNSPTGFGTFSLTSLASYSLTNPPAAVMANFPGVVVASSTHRLVRATNYTVTAYYAPPANGTIAGTPPVLKFLTNGVPYLATNYVTTFANVITNYSTALTTGILQTVTVTEKIGALAGTLTTNYSNVTVVLPVTNGSYYFVPDFGTNLCGSGILSTGLTTVIYSTNLIAGAVTNTSTTDFSTTVSLITSYTSTTYIAVPVNCSQDSAATGLFEGVGKVQFVRVDYDSLLGQTFAPITNGYTMMAVTNSQAVAEHFDREVTGPDILFTTEDDGLANDGNGTVTRSINFDQSQVANGLAGPGVIIPTSVLSFNNIGLSFWNGPFGDTNSFLIPTGVNETTQVPSVAWASFDQSTNDPVVYPNGTSIANLASLVMIQVNITNLTTMAVTRSLPDGTNGSPYVGVSGVQFGAVAPRLSGQLTWTATGLPSGLALSAQGVLSGTPVNPAGTVGPLIYDIVLTLTDALNNSVQWTYPISIH